MTDPKGVPFHPRQVDNLVGWIRTLLMDIEDFYREAYDMSYSPAKGDQVKVTDTSPTNSTERIATESYRLQRRDQLRTAGKLLNQAKDALLGATKFIGQSMGAGVHLQPIPTDKAREYARDRSGDPNANLYLYQQKRKVRGEE